MGRDPTDHLIPLFIAEVMRNKGRGGNLSKLLQLVNGRWMEVPPLPQL